MNAATNPIPDDALLNPEAAGAYLGISPRTLGNWRSAGVGPRYVRVGARSIRYRRGDLLAFIENGQSRDGQGGAA